MKTKKIHNLYIIMYKIDKEIIFFHGLWNSYLPPNSKHRFYFIYIGYHYQHKRKGFTLTELL